MKEDDQNNLRRSLKAADNDAGGSMLPPIGSASLAEFNEDEYRPYLSGLDLSDEQANELLRIVWDMMRMCVEMDVPAESWGQIVGSIIDASADDKAVVN